MPEPEPETELEREREPEQKLKSESESEQAQEQEQGSEQQPEPEPVVATATDDASSRRRLVGADRAASTLRWLCIGSFINASCSAVLSTAQTGLGLALAPSRAALLARMSMLVGASALGQVLLLPLCGRINDSCGRKPVMIGRSAFTFVFAGLLALRPSYGLLSFWRGCSNFSWMMWQTSVNASLADVFEGQELAVAISKIELYQGLAMLVGPIIGGRLAERSFRACFALSSCCGATNVLLYTCGLRETLHRRPHDDGHSSSSGGKKRPSLSPLGFLQLFTSGRELAMLTLAWTVSETCEGTYEIDRHWGVDRVGLSLTQDGLFNSLKGFSSVVGGWLVKPVLSRVSNRQFTCLTNLLGLAYLTIKSVAGTLRSPIGYMSCLIPATLGKGSYRSACLNSQLMKRALAAGMLEGQTTAAQANCRAIAMLVMPWVYSTLYSSFRESRLPGAPYLLSMLLMVCSQLIVIALGAKGLGDHDDDEDGDGTMRTS